VAFADGASPDHAATAAAAVAAVYDRRIVGRGRRTPPGIRHARSAVIDRRYRKARSRAAYGAEFSPSAR